MSLAIKYESVEDASMRLRNSVVLYDGVPHMVEAVEAAPAEDAKEIFRIRCYPLPRGTGPSIRKYISSKLFDLGAFPMGFINTEQGAVFCSRAPARQQSQGLTSKNFISEMVPAFNEVAIYGAPKKKGMNFDAFCESKELPLMLRNDYIPFAEACNVAQDKLISTAFSRELAVVPDRDLPFLLYLYHKTIKVGIVNDRVVTLGPKRKCLKELLGEKGVKVKE